jgi:hypothetical protein
MIRPPSLQKHQDDFYSGDPAFIQLPGDATEAQRVEHAHRWKVARETGNYSALLVEGQHATKFTMQPIKRNDWRAFADRASLPFDSSRRIGNAVLPSLLFRMSVVSISGLDIEIKRYPHREWDGWDMASVDVIEMLDSIDPRIVTELGELAFTRMSDISKNA